MEAKLYNHREHFSLVFSWWKKHSQRLLDINELGAQGLVIYSGETPVAAGWLFLTNSKVANIGWPVSNPDVPMRLRKEGISFLIDQLGEIARANHYTRVMTFSSSGGLTRRFQKQGYTKLIPHDFLMKVL